MEEEKDFILPKTTVSLLTLRAMVIEGSLTRERFEEDVRELLSSTNIQKQDLANRSWSSLVLVSMTHLYSSLVFTQLEAGEDRDLRLELPMDDPTVAPPVNQSFGHLLSAFVGELQQQDAQQTEAELFSHLTRLHDPDYYPQLFLRYGEVFFKLCELFARSPQEELQKIGMNVATFESNHE